MLPESTDAVPPPAPLPVAGPWARSRAAAVRSKLFTRASKPACARPAPKRIWRLSERAYRFAADRHKDQKRVSGEPYMIHPLLVTRQLADMHMDMVCLETGLLHDVVEDTSATIEEIRKEFGEEVARCVDGVTKLSKLDLASREERQAESVRKMLLAMVNDIRVILVKLADRLHNMRTLGSLPREKQRAHRAGNHGHLRAHRAPPGHGKDPRRAGGSGVPLSGARSLRRAAARIRSRPRPATKRFSNEIKHTVEVNLAREGIPARVETRVKRAYSVFQKLKRQKITLDQVYDLLAVRIITDSVKNCYAALGVIHNEWHPIPGRIKDFIAIPRPNLYQSLHTSVMGPGGPPFRSADPHRGDAPHRRRRHRGALEIQRRPPRPGR